MGVCFILVRGGFPEGDEFPTSLKKSRLVAWYFTR